MSMNNNHPSSSSFAHTGMIHPSGPANQMQPQMGASFSGQFPLSHAHAAMQAQLKAQHAHGQAANVAQIQAAHAQLQAQLQAQGVAGAQNPGLSNLGTSSSSQFNMPSNVGNKRVPPKPLGRPPNFPATATGSGSPMKASDAALSARKKKQKIQDKQLPDKVAAVLPESQLYTQLLEFEARVDAALARKKVDIQEALKNPPCMQKTLRIYVFNTYANQTKMVPNKQNAEPPSWTLKIIGRILEDGLDPDQPGMVHGSNPAYPKFSSFIKRMTVLLDQRLFPDNHTIQWENSRSSSSHEGFEVKRKGDKEFGVHIRLEMNYMPEKFKLSPVLTDVLGVEAETRPRIIAALWHYVKARKLQNSDDPSVFSCDPPLQKVFGEPRVKFSAVSQRISQHLFPPQPIHLEHMIKLSGDTPAGIACYDVVVDVPFPIQKELSAFLANVERNREIDACDEAICASIRRIHEHRRRRAFFLGFSQSPVEFINAMIESQNKDMRVFVGETSKGTEVERSSEFFNQPWVEDAVIRYLNRKQSARNDTPGST